MSLLIDLSPVGFFFSSLRVVSFLVQGTHIIYLWPFLRVRKLLQGAVVRGEEETPPSPGRFQSGFFGV